MAQEKIKILIADDHPFIRDGIKLMLTSVADFEIVGEAEDGEETIKQVNKLKPDVVILDISMPKLTGIEVAEELFNKHPEIKILALTMFENEEYIQKMLKYGAKGYLLKNARKKEFVIAIRVIVKDEYYFSKNISDKIISGYLNIEKPEQSTISNDTLTKREIEIIQQIAKELSNQEIANKLYISIRTVETHRRNIMYKLRIKSKVGLIKYAIENGLINTSSNSNR